jgi:hypothetical protein
MGVGGTFDLQPLAINPQPSPPPPTKKFGAQSPQTNGIYERFHRTTQNEFYAVAFRKKIYPNLEELQEDLDLWLKEYNEGRTHSGKYCFGKTPLQTFLDARYLKDEKMFDRLQSLTASLSVNSYRQIKSCRLQNLKIKAFYGTSKNAVLIQIWTALTAYLLLVWFKFKSKVGWGTPGTHPLGANYAHGALGTVGDAWSSITR